MACGIFQFCILFGLTTANTGVVSPPHAFIMLTTTQAAVQLAAPKPPAPVQQFAVDELMLPRKSLRPHLRPW